MLASPYSFVVRVHRCLPGGATLIYRTCFFQSTAKDKSFTVASANNIGAAGTRRVIRTKLPTFRRTCPQPCFCSVESGLFTSWHSSSGRFPFYG